MAVLTPSAVCCKAAVITPGRGYSTVILATQDTTRVNHAHLIGLVGFTKGDYPLKVQLSPSILRSSGPTDRHDHHRHHHFLARKMHRGVRAVNPTAMDAVWVDLDVGTMVNGLGRGTDPITVRGKPHAIRAAMSKLLEAPRPGPPASNPIGHMLAMSAIGSPLSRAADATGARSRARSGQHPETEIPHAAFAARMRRSRPHCRHQTSAKSSIDAKAPCTRLHIQSRSRGPSSPGRCGRKFGQGLSHHSATV